MVIEVLFIYVVRRLVYMYMYVLGKIFIEEKKYID